MRIVAILFWRNGKRYRVARKKKKWRNFRSVQDRRGNFRKAFCRELRRLLDQHRRRRCLPLSFSPFTMPPAVKPDNFLTELHKMYERTKAKGSISLTTSRSKIEGSFWLFFFGDRPTSTSSTSSGRNFLSRASSEPNPQNNHWLYHSKP